MGEAEHEQGEGDLEYREGGDRKEALTHGPMKK